MNFKACQVINEKFSLDANNVPYFEGVNGKVFITEGMEKGYIYAALYFYDDVAKEIAKLEKMVRKIVEECLMEAPGAKPALLVVDVSRRVALAIGNDSLDVLIKQVLSEREKNISLMPTPEETKKYDDICESIFLELTTALYDSVIQKSTKGASDISTSTLTQKYIDAMTERQKKLLAPALKMVAFLNGIKLDDFRLTDDFNVYFTKHVLKKTFDEQEKIIKEKLKKLMAENS